MIGRHIASIQEITESYNYYIIDIYGVLYDGSQIIRSALDAVQALRDAHKKIVLLSNMPRSAEFARSLLIHKTPVSLQGTWSNLDIYTSGEFFAEVFIAAQEQIKAFVIGGDSKRQIISEINQRLLTLQRPTITLVTDIQEADYIIILAAVPSNDVETVQHYVSLMRNLPPEIPILCPNPDITAPYKEGCVFYTPGFFAAHYARIHGDAAKIHYFGKPYPAIYQQVLRTFWQIEPGRESILGIGDSIAHDVAGIQSIGGDALWITGDSDNNPQITSMPQYIMTNLA